MRDTLTISRAIIVLFFLLLAAAPVRGQADDPPPPEISISWDDGEDRRIQTRFHGIFGVPVGEFSDFVGLTGGLGGEFSYRFGDTPIRLGGQMTWLQYGRETRLAPLSLTIPDVLVDVTTSGNILASHAIVRVQPFTGRFRPYVEGLLGFGVVFTQTSADLSNDRFSGDSFSTTNQSAVALSTGGGGGVMIGMLAGQGMRLDLDVGVRYLYGGEVDYLVRTSRRSAPGVAGLERVRSRTDVVAVLAGIVIDF